MNRRAFLQGLLGVAAGAVIPTPVKALVDALEPVVAIGNEPIAGILSYWIKIGAQKWNYVQIPVKDISNVTIPLPMLQAGDGVQFRMIQTEYIASQVKSVMHANWRMTDEQLKALTK